MADKNPHHNHINRRCRYEHRVGARRTELVRAGPGWSILPYIALDNFDGYIQELKWLKGVPFTHATWLCYKKNSLISRAVASFVQYVEETMTP